MNTSSEKIEIIIQKTENGWAVYDDTKNFLELIPTIDSSLIPDIVKEIVKDRINGTEPPPIW